MNNIKSISDIIRERKETVEHYTTKIELWEAVTIKKKKNGEEFSELSNRCVEGAKFQAQQYGSGYELYAGGWRGTPGASKYEYDTLNMCGYCDELPEGDKRKVSNSGGWRTQYVYTPAEARDQIAAQIERYKAWRLEAQQEIDWLEQHAGAITAAVEDMRTAYILPAKAATEHSHLDSYLSEAIGYMLRWGVK